MAFTVTDYDPKNIVVIVNGQRIDGFADGSFVSIERNEDSWSYAVGADGSCARARSRNISGTLTLTLMQTSKGNEILEALMIADDTTSQGQFSWAVADEKYTGLVSSGAAWIQKPATIEYGKEMNDRVWTITCAQILYANAFATKENDATPVPDIP